MRSSSSERGVRAEPDASRAHPARRRRPARLKTEVDKIATWAGDEPVGEREVEALVEPSFDSPDGNSARHGRRGTPPGRSHIARTYSSESRGSGETSRLGLVGQLRAHVGRVRAVKRLASEGVSSKEVAEQLKLKPFYASKLYRQAEGFSDDELDDAILRIAALDGALKGQSKLTPDLEVQRTLVALSRKPGAAASARRRRRRRGARRATSCARRCSRAEPRASPRGRWCARARGTPPRHARRRRPRRQSRGAS